MKRPFQLPHEFKKMSVGAVDLHGELIDPVEHTIRSREE